MRRAVLLLALLALAPAAQAQLPPLPGGPGAGSTDVVVTMQLQDPGGALVPVRPYSLVLFINYQYGPGGQVQPAPGAEPAGSGYACGEVTVPEPPPWANVSVLPPTVCFLVSSLRIVAGQTVTNQTIVEINVTEGAPALEPFNFTVVFEAPAQGTLAAVRGEVSRVIMPAYVGRVAVEPPPVVVARGGGATPVPVLVRNLGNGPVEVRFRNATAPQGVRFELPERVVVERNASLTVQGLLHSPWTTPVRGLVQFDVENGHPTQPALVGESVHSRLNVEGKAAVPGVEAAAMLALLVFTAWLRRRA